MTGNRNSTSHRAAPFSRNTELEKLLHDINTALWPAERALLNASRAPSHPLILVMGPMRSGTTLFMQWLANTSLVAYPSNLLSRFYNAPILGAKIQRLLTDPAYNFRDELGDFRQRAEYRSENGKTQGALSPNEFWYFWRRFLADANRDVWTNEELHATMDISTMRAELGGIMDVFEKPFAAKGMLFNYNIDFIDATFEKLLLVQVRRDPVANVASALEARRRQFGRDDIWYSFMIPEYERLKDLDPLHQVAGQISFTGQAVSRGMTRVADARKIVIQYEDFCADPARVFRELTERLQIRDAPYAGPASFDTSRATPPPDADAIAKALQSFS